MTFHTSHPERGNRQRRAHQKSRRGCGNCKLRRVKCDETRPQCLKCISFCVSCNFDMRSDELQIAMNGTSVFTPLGTSVSIQRTVLGMINTPPKMCSSSPTTAFPVYELGLKDLEIVDRFQSRTVLTLGTKENVHIIQREWFKVACEHSMLMHIVLAMTLMHDRFLLGFAETPPSVSEAYHHYQGTMIFNRKLTNYELHERDALWAATALLGSMSFANIDARTPEEAWPLRAPCESDLDWLRMSDGKRAVWNLVDPMREDSVVREAWQQMNSSTPASEPLLASCPTFFELNSLRDCTAGEDEPYNYAASILIPLLTIECNHSTIGHFLSFTGHTDPEYRRLLEEKDPLALLLLAYWYGKMCQYRQWWIMPRAVLECQAICVYLGRTYGEEDKIVNLLPFPKAMCGLETR